METPKVDGKRIVRSLELRAFRGVVNALRAQGSLTENKQDVLKRLASTLKIGEERCRCELRRAVNDEFLTSLAQCSNGKNTDEDWRLLSARKIPLTPMIAPQTVFTALADNVADLIALENPRLPPLSASLQAIADARKLRTDANSSQYHSSKLLGSLLSGKSFRNDTIEPYIDEIALREKYARHGWPWPPVPVEESQVFVEQTTQKISNQCDVEINEELSGIAHRQSEISVDYAIESNHSVGSGRVCEKSSSKRKLPEINDGIGIIREQSDEPKVEPVVPRKRGRPRRVDSLKSAHNTIASVDSKRNARSRLIRDHTRRRTRRPDRRRLKRSKIRDQIESVVDEESVLETAEIGTRVIPKLEKEPASTMVASSRRKDRSRQIIDIDFDEIEIGNVKENDEQERYEANVETTISTSEQVKEEPRRLSFDDFKFNIDLSQLYEDETKPHTFNLIPASRRLKLMQKRVSMNADDEIPFKRTVWDKNSVSSTVLCDLSNGSVDDVLSKEDARKLQFNNMNSKETTDLIGYVPDGYRDKESFAFQSGTTKKLSLLGSITLRTLNSTPPIRPENLARLANSCDNVNQLSSAKAVQDESGRLLGFLRKNETEAIEDESAVGSSDFESSEEYSSPPPSSSSSMSPSSPAPSIPEKLPKNYSKSQITLDDNADNFVEEHDESNESERSLVEMESMKLESSEDDLKDERVSEVFSDGIQEITLDMKPDDLTSENEEIIVIESNDEEIETTENEELSINEKGVDGLMKINVSPVNVELKTTKLKSTTLTLRCGPNVQVIDSPMEPRSSKLRRRVPSDDKKSKKSSIKDCSPSNKDCSNKNSPKQNINQKDSVSSSARKSNKIVDSSVNDVIENGETEMTVKENVRNVVKKKHSIGGSSRVGDFSVHNEKTTRLNGVISTSKSLKPGIPVTTKSIESFTESESNSRDTKNSSSTCDGGGDRSSADKISRNVPKKMIELYNAIENTDFLELLQKRMKL